MFRLLERMSFDTVFLQWIKLIYTAPQAHLIINQNIQPALHPTRGVKQGDPLYALLFILTIETLGNLLCLKADHTAMVMFFADDSTLLGGSIPNLQAELEIVEEYATAPVRS